MPLCGCRGKTTPPSATPSSDCPGKTTPPPVTTPLVTTAFIRVTPKSEEELEADETINAITYVYQDRVVTIWESSLYDYPDQQEEDDIARNRIIWERLNPTADWFLCHMDGTRIESGESIEHRDRILIGNHDEVDPTGGIAP
jgi:hypothetical protein